MRDDPGWWWAARWWARHVRWPYAALSAAAGAWLAWSSLGYPGWRW